jgi:acetyl-CoA acetyltransferase
MSRYGTTQKQLAMIAAKNHHHGSLNPDAQYRMDMTVEEVLADRLVSHPLTRAMCAPMGDGAAAAILVSGDYLRRLTDARPVKVRASVLASGSTRPGGREKSAVQKAYQMAGVGPEDIDTAEVHDATAFGELAQTESLGFCGEGEGGPYAESGATKLGGARPINPSGGLECRGHPIGATGLAQIAEIVYQLRGDAGERQVEGARLGLTQNGGGFIGNGEAALAIHILEGPPTSGSARG